MGRIGTYSKAFMYLLALNHVYYLIKIKLNNFYKMGRAKWGKNKTVKCVKYRQSEKGRRQFK